MKINDAGLKLIKEYEGCKLKAYLDAVHVWTIGYGHTGGCYGGRVITQEEADELLKSDIESFEEQVDNLIDIVVNENQYSAIIAFVFNLGAHAFKNSTLLVKLNEGDFAGAAKEFLRWNKAGGLAMPGLTRRRQAEKDLFCS